MCRPWFLESGAIIVKWTHFLCVVSVLSLFCCKNCEPKFDPRKKTFLFEVQTEINFETICSDLRFRIKFYFLFDNFQFYSEIKFFWFVPFLDNMTRYDVSHQSQILNPITNTHSSKFSFSFEFFFFWGLTNFVSTSRANRIHGINPLLLNSKFFYKYKQFMIISLDILKETFHI